MVGLQVYLATTVISLYKNTKVGTKIRKVVGLARLEGLQPSPLHVYTHVR